jgi:zinc protease
LKKKNSNTHPHIEKLSNGLTILLKEIHTVPLISQWIWYRVGSRNEVAGKTGISHFVEHIQFKGTPKYPIQQLDHAISRDGGIWNAMTYLDWTTYFETMPVDKIDLSFELEADRMVNSSFAIEDIEMERTVIISEREGNENEPLFRLGEAVQKAAFYNHPYRQEVIGELEDLKQITRDDLVHFYHQNYNPSNAIITIAGDFSTTEVIKRLTELYEPIPSFNNEAGKVNHDSPLSHEEHVLVKGPGETTYLQLAYRAPRANEKDFFIMTVLDSILTGPASLNMFGGGSVANKTSRLYQELIEKDLAVNVSGGLAATIDPFLFEISITVHPQHSVDGVLSAVDREINKVLEKKVEEKEIRRAIKQAKALFAYGSENITNQAFWMGYSNMFADYRWFETYIESLESVSDTDILSKAQQYLNPERRVIGIYQPTNGRA